MATPPPSKRFHLFSPPHSLFNQVDVGKIVSDAQNIPFPWNEAIPENINQWFTAYGKSHNTAPEYVFIGALVTTAILMGPKSFIKVRDTYKEPTNLYAICIGFPGSGKSQAYRMTVAEPIQRLTSPLSTILVDDYTKKGLFRHLQNHDGRALLAHEEMGSFFDLVHKRQLEGNAERQLYCRLYDGGQWISSTGLRKSEGRQEVEHNCVCIYGYLQPQPFVERIYPQLTECDDGFVDRLLLCFPKAQILLEEEVDEWCEQLHKFSLQSLVEPFRRIAKWHEDGHQYTFSEEGMTVYRKFANDMAEMMNSQWEQGILTGNMSKDKRTMIRLSGVIHILYKALSQTLGNDQDSLIESDSDSMHVDDQPSEYITEEEAQMAVVLTEYFQEQRRVYEQVCAGKGRVAGSPTHVQTSEAIPTLILLSKGAFCTPRSIIRSVTTKSKPTTGQVIEGMKQLHEENVGIASLDEKEKVLYKLLPTEDSKELVGKYVAFDEYEENFKKAIDIKLITAAQLARLLKNCPHKDALVADYNYKL